MSDPPFISSNSALPGESQQAFVERQIAEQVAGFDSSRQFYRRGFYWATLATAALSALTTVLIAVSKVYPSLDFISMIAIVCSSAITVVTAWDGFFRHKELWIQKTDTWMELQGLEATIHYEKTKSDGVLTTEQLDAFYKAFERILGKEHESWKKVRSTQGSTGRR